jgi:hypothetical protein
MLEEIRRNRQKIYFMAQGLLIGTYDEEEQKYDSVFVVIVNRYLAKLQKLERTN